MILVLEEGMALQEAYMDLGIATAFHYSFLPR